MMFDGKEQAKSGKSLSKVQRRTTKYNLTKLPEISFKSRSLGNKSQLQRRVMHFRLRRGAPDTFTSVVLKCGGLEGGGKSGGSLTLKGGDKRPQARQNEQALPPKRQEHI